MAEFHDETDRFALCHMCGSNFVRSPKINSCPECGSDFVEEVDLRVNSSGQHHNQHHNRKHLPASLPTSVPVSRVSNDKEWSVVKELISFLHTVPGLLDGCNLRTYTGTQLCNALQFFWGVGYAKYTPRTIDSSRKLVWAYNKTINPENKMLLETTTKWRAIWSTRLAKQELNATLGVPLDIFEHILSFLSPKDIVRTKLVCINWNKWCSAYESRCLAAVSHQFPPRKEDGEEDDWLESDEYESENISSEETPDMWGEYPIPEQPRFKLHSRRRKILRRNALRVAATFEPADEQP